jgi:CDP-paratose synthetase
MKTILITGINGYLGSNLAKRYSNKYNIIGLEYDCTDLFRLKEYHFEVFASKDGIPEELFEKYKIDIIIHTATFYGKNNESDSEMFYSNTYLPQLLLEKAIKNGCELFINTDTVLDRFTSSYSLTKKQFSDWLDYYSKNTSMRVVNLKLEHFFGPGTANTNFITLMIQKMLNNDSVIALTKCEQNRDFLYIDDLLRVYDLMLKSYNNFESYENFYVGTGKDSNLKEILEFIKIETSSISKLDYGIIPYRNNELMESKNDISKLKNLGWLSKISILEGLLEVIKFEKNNLKK